MGTTKKYSYQSNQLQFADLCKALGHPARVAIVQLLSQNNHLNCNEIQSKLSLSQSTISWHCSLLQKFGIVGYEQVGNNCYFRLNTRVIDILTDHIDAINTNPITLTDSVYYPAQYA